MGKHNVVISIVSAPIIFGAGDVSDFEAAI